MTTLLEVSSESTPVEELFLTLNMESPRSRTKLSDLDPALASISKEEETVVLSILEDRDKIIRLQQRQLECLKADLRKVKAERDLLQIRLAANMDGQQDTSGHSTDGSYTTDGTDDT